MGGLGCPGWGWDDVLPYFKRAEDNERGATELPRRRRPAAVSDARSMHPLVDAFVEAARGRASRANDDFNSASRTASGRYQVTQRNGMRCSTAVAYLHPALERANLTLITEALAHPRAVRRRPRERRRGACAATSSSSCGPSAR